MALGLVGRGRDGEVDGDGERESGTCCGARCRKGESALAEIIVEVRWHNAPAAAVDGMFIHICIYMLCVCMIHTYTYIVHQYTYYVIYIYTYMYTHIFLPLLVSPKFAQCLACM